MKPWILPALAATCFLASAAHAAEGETGIYAIAALGVYKVDLDAAAGQVDSIPGATISTQNDRHAGQFALGAGYWFTPHLAVELSFRDYAETSTGAKAHAGSALASPLLAEEKTTLEADGWGIGLLGFLSVTEDFHLYGRLDAVKLDADLVYEFRTATGAREQVSLNDSQLNPGLGFGIQYDLARHFSLRGEFYRVEAKLDDLDERLDSFSVGLLAHF